MTSRSPALLVTIAGALLATAPWLAAQQQTFRASADVVIVDVSVRQGGQPVAGLTAADFVVLDNGVRQDIERVEATAVPIDLTIVADVSYKHAEVMNTLRKDLADIGGTLRPFDRIRVIAFDDHVREIVPFQPATAPITLTFIPRGHQGSLTDAVITALATPVEPDRRHVVVLRTRGTDTISLTAASRIQDVAASSDAQLHIIFDEMTVFQELEERSFRCGKLDRCLPMENFWQPHRITSQVVDAERLVLTPFGTQLQDAAVATGGQLHLTSLVSPPTVRSTFEKVFAQFRESYVLRYIPKGVTREGWHNITVTVPGQRRAVVRARRGYGVDAPPPPGNSRVWLTPDTSGPVWSLVMAFDSRQYDTVARSLLATRDIPRLIAEVREAGNPWPTEPWREAVLALELAEVALSNDEKARRAGFDLLQAQARVIRHPFEADDFERYWHWAVVAIGQGTLKATEMRWTIDEALRRFPDEPRFVLGKAISADQEWSFRDPRSQPRVLEPPSFRGVIEPMYRAAMRYSETEGEARVRLAWGLFRQGAFADALALLQDAKVDARDPAIAYLRDVFRGHSLVSLHRHAEAVDAYRQAIGLLPTAQSAQVSLMNTLMVIGTVEARAEAEALAESIQTTRANVSDPWWTYWQGDYRLYPSLIQYLRDRAR